MNQSSSHADPERFHIGSILLWALLIVGQVICLPAPANEPALAPGGKTAAATTSGPRNDLPGLKNFAEVSPVLSRGAQPTHSGFVTLKSRGIKTIVNLRSEHSDRALLAGTGLQYVEILCNPWHIRDAEVVKFLKVARDPKNQPVFVHCAYGADRTGAMVGAYLELEQNRSADDAVNELGKFGYHASFTQIAKYLKAFDSTTIRAKIDAALAPNVEVIP